MIVPIRRLLLSAAVFGFIVGTTIALGIAADSAPNMLNCGGPPAKEGGARTDNANCKTCVKGCQFADSGYKVCQDAGTGCVFAKLPTFKQCDGEVWTKTDCTGMKTGGACQAARKICQ